MEYCRTIEEIIPWLKANGKTVGKHATKDNCQLSIDIIKYYQMICRCYDPMTEILLDEAIKKYEQHYEKGKNKE